MSAVKGPRDSRSASRSIGLVTLLLVGGCFGSLALGGLLLRTLSANLARRALATPGVGPLMLIATPEPDVLAGATAELGPPADATAMAYAHALSTIAALQGLATQAEAKRAAGGTSGQGPMASPIADSPAQLAALGRYLQRVRPLLNQGLEAAQRDGLILEAAREQPALLCPGGSFDPTLAADAVLMDQIYDELTDFSFNAPTAVLASVQRPLQNSVKQWAEGLHGLQASCSTGSEVERSLRQLGAGAQLAQASLNFRGAVESYWRIVMATGLDAFGAAQP